MWQRWHSNLIRYMVEMQAYGFFSTLGQFMRVSQGAIRLWFTYLTFMTFLSPVIVGHSLSFISQMRRHFRRSRSPILDF